MPFPTESVVHVGDVLTVYESELVDEDDQVLDVSTASTQQIRFEKPDGTTVDKPTVFTVDGIDGKIQYVAEVGFHDQPGAWKREAHVVLASGATYTADRRTFTVQARLAAPP